MSSFTLRRSNAWFLSLGLASWLAFYAAAASAASTAVFFDGPTQGGQNFGLSGAMKDSALAAGLSIVATPNFDTTGVIDIVDQSLDSVTLGNVPSTPFEQTSVWTAQNKLSTSFEGTVYMVFTTVDPHTMNVPGGGSQPVNYDATQVGLRIDSATGWVLLQTSAAGLGTLYYAAVALPGSSFAPGANKNFAVNYVLNQIISFPSGNETFVPLPKLHINFAFVPVPEPASGLLVAAGLIGLAVRARSRS